MQGTAVSTAGNFGHTTRCVFARLLPLTLSPLSIIPLGLKWASIMASATPGCLWTTPQHCSTGGKARARTPT
jgi:hypothetical protein